LYFARRSQKKSWPTPSSRTASPSTGAAARHLDARVVNRRDLGVERAGLEQEIGLRRRAIDLLHRRLDVPRQIVEVGSRFQGFDQPKTEAGRRRVDPLPFVCQIVDEQLDLAQPGPDGLVFVSTRGNPPHLSSLTWRT
jgi:hypothetical protein